MSKRHGKRGSSLPETVIVMIVLLTLTFGLMDFGRAIYTFAWITDIAQRADRWAIVRGSNCTKLDHCGINGSNDYPSVFVLGNAFGIVNPASIGVSTNDDGTPVTELSGICWFCTSPIRSTSCSRSCPRPRSTSGPLPEAESPTDLP